MSGFLCSMVGASFTVMAAARTANTITANGNAQVSTAQSQFGGASALFDGNGDYLNIPTDTTFNFGTGDFTLEAWVRRTSQSGDTFILSASGSGGLFWGFRNGTEMGWGQNAISWDYNVAAGLSINTWYHVALTRSGTSMRMFVNGTQIGTTQTNSISYNLSTTSFTIGSQGANYYYDGYIDEVRVSNSPRYTANFTAPAVPLVNDANTVFLMHADGTNASTTFTDDNTAYAQPTYAVAAAGGATSVNEGSSLTFNVTTANVADSTTLYYTVSANSGDFGTSSGSFIITSNAGSFSLTPTADTTTEGSETFAAQVRTVSTSGTVVATSSSITINDTSLTATTVSTTSFTNALFNWNQYHVNQLAYAGLDTSSRPVFGFSTKDVTSTYPTFTLFRVNSDLTITQGSKNTITSVAVDNSPVAAIDTDNNYGYCTYCKGQGMFAKTFTIDKDNLSIGTAGTEAEIFPSTDAGFVSSSYAGNGRVIHWHRRGGQVSAAKYTTRSGTTLTVATNELADSHADGDVYHEIRAFDRSADLYRIMHVGNNSNPQATAQYYNNTSASTASSITNFSWSLGGGITHRNIVRLKAADKFMILAKGATTAQVAAGTVTWPGSGTTAPTIAQGAVLSLTDLPNGNLYGAVDGFANDEAYIVYKKNSDSLFYWRKITASTNTLTEGSANLVSIGSASTTGALILSNAQAFSKKLIVAVADNSGSSSPDILVMVVT